MPAGYSSQATDPSAGIAECEYCRNYTTAVEARFRKFNRGRCAKCGGPLKRRLHTRSHSWAMETMRQINKLTPGILNKALDPDWFLLRQRLELYEELFNELAEALDKLRA